MNLSKYTLTEMLRKFDTQKRCNIVKNRISNVPNNILPSSDKY